MYLAVDIGGSKTLLAVFSSEGKIITEHKLATHKNYRKFIAEIKEPIQSLSKTHKITAACCGVPGTLNRDTGVALELGNLPWHNVPIKKDLGSIVGNIHWEIENDAKLAALSEAKLVHEKYKKVLYLTLSTGIGAGLIIDGKVDHSLIDMEAGRMILEHEGKLRKWEDFASGRALMQKYGKLASEIEDPKIWEEYALNVALGLDVILSIVQPEVVVVGGGVGAHFEKFGDKLEEELKKLTDKMVGVPPVIQAKRPEEAVIYGCYDYVSQ